MNPSTFQQRLDALFTRQPEILLAYLFGSQVSGHTGPQSDTDLGVLIAREKVIDPTELRARLTHEVIDALGTVAVDIVLLNQAPIELAYHVIAQGRLLYCRRRAAQVDYEAYVLERYGDYLPVLRAQRQQIIKNSSHATRVQRYRAALGRTERTLGTLTADS